MKELQSESIACQWNNPHGIWVVLKLPPLATLWPVENGSSSKPKKKQSKKTTKRA